MDCEKTSSAPKDARPRSRFLFRGNSSASQFQGLEATYLGSSSLVHLAWKYAPQRSAIIDKMRGIDDLHDFYRGSIGGLEQDGLLVGQSVNEGRKADRSTMVSVNMMEAKLVQELGAASILSDLYQVCRDRIIPYFPVISVSESLLTDKPSQEHVAKYAALDPHSTPPTPLPHIVRMLHCAIASQLREVPQTVRLSLTAWLHRLLVGPEMNKIFATRCLGSIQVLLLLSLCDDLNGGEGSAAIENVWHHVGVAVRMGISIGLHRNITSSHVPHFQMNRRLRVWGASVCMDRWLGLRLGRGTSIDLAAGDAPLPRHYADGIRDGDLQREDGGVFPCFRFLSEFTSLSILLGRAQALIGSPRGLLVTDDLTLTKLQVDIDHWIAQLPAFWQYSINLNLDQAAHLMNLFIVALEFTFQRRFLWPVTPIPAQITFRPIPERWMSLSLRAEQAVRWLNTPDGAFYLDVWSNTVYPAFCCIIIHFKGYEELRTPHRRELLESSVKAIQHWSEANPSNSLRTQLASMGAVYLAAADDPSDSPIPMDSSIRAILEDDIDPMGSQADLGGPSTLVNPGIDLDAFLLDPMWFENF